MIVAFLIFTMVTLGTVSIFSGSSKMMSQTAMQTYTDTDASFALQYVLKDIREAKLFSIQTTNSASDTLVLTFPIKTAGGWYDRTTADINNPATYYLSDASGTLGRTGKYLWKSQGGALQLLRKNIALVQFTQDTTRSVKVTISAAPWDYYKKRTQDVAYWSTLSSRTAFLRNF